MAVLADPTGAIVSVWQPRTNIGAQVRDEDNTLSWNELITPDGGKAKAFYGEVFGWKHTDMDMPQGTYTTSKIGGNGGCVTFIRIGRVFAVLASDFCRPSASKIST